MGPFVPDASCRLSGLWAAVQWCWTARIEPRRQEVSLGGFCPSQGMLSLSAVPTSPFFLHGCNPTPKFPRFTKYAYGRFECVESRRCSDTSNKVRWTKSISYTVWGPHALSTGPQQTSRGKVKVGRKRKGKWCWWWVGMTCKFHPS